LVVEVDAVEDVAKRAGEERKKEGEKCGEGTAGLASAPDHYQPRR
jgi:hypothetical protein